jgi:hypothetical protein
LTVTGPLLLGYASHNIDVKEEIQEPDSWKKLPAHRDEDQVRLDVDRSFIYYPSGRSKLLYGHISPGADRFAQTSPRRISIVEKQSYLTS